MSTRVRATRQARRLRDRAFILFEAMLAVTIFSLAVLGLGKCVQNCLRAEMVKDEDSRARRCLANRMAEVEAQAVNLTARETTEELKDAFAGMTLRQKRVEVKRKNEKGQNISGLFAVTLDLSWKSRGETQNRTLQFYVFPRQ
jgi:acyl-coenzyme A synthetase/AMP-(fatty) acid ligase